MTEEIFAGDDSTLEFTVYQSDETTPLDLTNVDIIWALSTHPSETALVTKDSTNTGEINIVNATEGRFDVLLVPSDTSGLDGREYYQEVELTDANDKQFTVFDGELKVKETLIA